MKGALLKIEKVDKKYDEKSALHSISIGINVGQSIAIVGETGSGKSTLLKLMAGLVDTDNGTVFFNKIPILGPKDKLIPGHPDIVYLSQHFELPKFISVFEHLDAPYEVARDDAEKIYTACHINHLLNKNTRQLSGGEKQRVALAKSLLKLPQVLLLDEPFSNLDTLHKQLIKKVLEDVKQLWDLTIVMVSHEPRDVLPWADSVVVMREGKVVQSDTPWGIYHQPVNEYVAGLFGKYNLVDSADWALEKAKKYTSIGNRLLIRPESIDLTDNGRGKLGVVSHTYFYGNFYELTVEIRGLNKSFLVETQKQYEIGDEVYISLKSKEDYQ